MYMVKFLESKRITPPFFPRIANTQRVAIRFIAVFLRIFFIREFINVVSRLSTYFLCLQVYLFIFYSLYFDGIDDVDDEHVGDVGWV